MNLSDALTILICGGLPLLLGGVVIVLGIWVRFRLGSRMFRSIANGQSKIWDYQRNSKRLRILLSIALISTAGLIVIPGVVVVLHIPLTALLQKFLIFLLLVVLLTSILISREIFGQIDKPF